MSCPACESDESIVMQTVGNVEHLRCRECHADYSRPFVTLAQTFVPPGTPVQVHQVVAGGADPTNHVTDWSGGYLLLSAKVGETTALLERTEGPFAGAHTHFDLHAVRPVP